MICINERKASWTMGSPLSVHLTVKALYLHKQNVLVSDLAFSFATFDTSPVTYFSTSIGDPQLVLIHIFVTEKVNLENNIFNATFRIRLGRLQRIGARCPARRFPRSSPTGLDGPRQPRPRST